MGEAESNGRLRVLVVDDNWDAADSLRVLLQFWNHEAQVAYDGAGALQAACAFAPDIAILDIRMPAMSGIEVGRRLRATPGLEHIVLIALSATDPDDDAMGENAELFDEYLIKPIRPERLENLLEQYAARRRR